MAVARIKEVLECDIEKVWRTVTSLEDYSWRSDIERIQKMDENKFVEFAKGGIPTLFTVTSCEPFERWEFDLENENMKGHWTGIFSRKGGATEIEFTEEVEAKKLVMKPFVKSYLKVQQFTYIEDLKKALGL